MSQFQDDLVSMIPHMRAFARTLTGWDATQADDLVQDTLIKALKAQDRFQRGTNLKAWLFTIMHNHFRSLGRSKRTRSEVPIDDLAHQLWCEPRQEERLEMVALRRALGYLSPAQRQVLVMVCVQGCTYEQAAEACNCEVGTVRSRLNRARTQLKAMLLEGELPVDVPHKDRLSEGAKQRVAEIPLADLDKQWVSNEPARMRRAGRAPVAD